MCLSCILSTGETAGKRSASDYGKLPSIKPATMNEMPTPQGSWAHDYARKQAKYNMQLIAGIGILGATIFTVKHNLRLIW